MPNFDFLNETTPAGKSAAEGMLAAVKSQFPIWSWSITVDKGRPPIGYHVGCLTTDTLFVSALIKTHGERMAVAAALESGDPSVVLQEPMYRIPVNLIRELRHCDETGELRLTLDDTTRPSIYDDGSKRTREMFALLRTRLAPNSPITAGKGRFRPFNVRLLKYFLFGEVVLIGGVAWAIVEPPKEFGRPEKNVLGEIMRQAILSLGPTATVAIGSLLAIALLVFFVRLTIQRYPIEVVEIPKIAG